MSRRELANFDRSGRPTGTAQRALLNAYTGEQPVPEPIPAGPEPAERRYRWTTT